MKRLGGALVVGVLVASCAAHPLSSGPATPVSSPQPASSSPSQPPPTSPASVVTNGSSLFTITYDAVRSALWYVTGDDAGHPVLRRVDLGNASVHDVRLPSDYFGYIGIFSPLKVGQDGAVWLTNDDRIVRYD